MGLDAVNQCDGLIKNNISKYNLTGTSSDVPQRYCILVPGQVEDDASTQRCLVPKFRFIHASNRDAIASQLQTLDALEDASPLGHPAGAIGEARVIDDFSDDFLHL